MIMRFCTILGIKCYKECPHYYYRELNGCCKSIKRDNDKKRLNGRSLQYSPLIDTTLLLKVRQLDYVNEYIAEIYKKRTG